MRLSRYSEMSGLGGRDAGKCGGSGNAPRSLPNRFRDMPGMSIVDGRIANFAAFIPQIARHAYVVAVPMSDLFDNLPRRAGRSAARTYDGPRIDLHKLRRSAARSRWRLRAQVIRGGSTQRSQARRIGSKSSD